MCGILPIGVGIEPDSMGFLFLSHMMEFICRVLPFVYPVAVKKKGFPAINFHKHPPHIRYGIYHIGEKKRVAGKSKRNGCRWVWPWLIKKGQIGKPPAEKRSGWHRTGMGAGMANGLQQPDKLIGNIVVAVWPRMFIVVGIVVPGETVFRYILLQFGPNIGVGDAVVFIYCGHLGGASVTGFSFSFDKEADNGWA